MHAIWIVLGTLFLLLALFAGGCVFYLAAYAEGQSDNPLLRQLLILNSVSFAFFAFLAWAFLGRWPGEDE